MPRTTRSRSVALAGAVVTALALCAPLASATAADDVPPGAPAAARRVEPRLPAADGWPFGERWSRTSGTGRLYDGASYWTDFLHDDHGAASPTGFSTPGTADLAPEQGAYEYPDGPARGNGADVFRTAIGLDRSATYWRVDWNTLVDPDVPLAVWTFDTDSTADTGESAWPAAAGVASPGMEKALVVSSRGAWVVDLVTGQETSVVERGGRLTVDEAARSFVVRVPRTLLDPSGRWTVRLATGLSAEDGKSFAMPELPGGLPALGMPRVYNVSFRGVRQEPPVYQSGDTAAFAAAFGQAVSGNPLLDDLGVDGLSRFITGNFWMEDHQADAIAAGDVSEFAQRLDWSTLAKRRSTPEPRPTGYSNRWYVSALPLGEGVVENEPGGGDLRPNFLGRVQSYAVYVPRSSDPAEPMPLTWVLHSLGVNHNQYGALNPRLLQQLCEDRGSVCATTNGYGPDGWYHDEAEVDYWSVWRELGEAYQLDPRRTVISGYSMGGYATYKLGLAHPDLYAAAVSLAGPPQCGVTLDGGQVGGPAGDGRCSTDGTTGALVPNARWLPYRIGHGTADELVPFTSVEAQVRRFDSRRLRHRFVRYPGEDHLAFATQDRFDTVVDGLGRPTVKRDPDQITYRWFPHLSRPRLGVGATGAYWLSRLGAREDSAGSLAFVHARSLAVPRRGIRVVRTGPTPVAEPLPAAVTTLDWEAGAGRTPRRLVRLHVRNVSGLSVDLERASLRCGTVRVRTDGPTVATLTGLRPDAKVTGAVQGRTSADGVVRVPVGAGQHVVRVSCR